MGLHESCCRPVLQIGSPTRSICDTVESRRLSRLRDEEVISLTIVDSIRLAHNFNHVERVETTTRYYIVE